jgi:hypothetical protein
MVKSFEIGDKVCNKDNELLGEIKCLSSSGATATVSATHKARVNYPKGLFYPSHVMRTCNLIPLAA